MRILIANDGFGDAGGVQSYLDAVMTGLRARGHQLAVLTRDPASSADRAAALDAVPRFSFAVEGLDLATEAVRRWRPDVAFSHNMERLDVERRLLDTMPVVKFMHGYFGTCIGGQKMFSLPTPRPCGRTFGPACLALYAPGHCGPMDPVAFVRQYRWAGNQRSLFARYRAIVVASDHMRREYVRNGADPSRVLVNPLFPTHDESPCGACSTPSTPSTLSIAFFGRMTNLKGGDLLIDAVAEARPKLGRAIHVTMAGDGPRRADWEKRAAVLGVSATFVGWLRDAERWTWLRKAALLAVPSVWPEPFGLVGLEAGALGVPSIAFDVGGIREWLVPEESGILVTADPPSASALADGLVRAFTRPDALRGMGEAARAIARRMSLARHLDRLETVLAPSMEPVAHSAGR